MYKANELKISFESLLFESITLKTTMILMRLIIIFNSLEESFGPNKEMHFKELLYKISKHNNWRFSKESDLNNHLLFKLTKYINFYFLFLDNYVPNYFFFLFFIYLMRLICTYTI